MTTDKQGVFTNDPFRLLMRQRWRAETRCAWLFLLQMGLLGCAFWVALAVRFDFHLRSPAGLRWTLDVFLPLLPLVLATKAVVFLSLGLHRNTWRYVGLRDLLSLIAGSALSLVLISVIYYVMSIATLGADHTMLPAIPRTLFPLDFVLGVLFISGAKVLARLVHEESRPTAATGLSRLLVIGAGDAAENLLREIRRMPEQKYRVIGLLDDSPSKQRTRIHGIPVLGTINDLGAVCVREQIGEVLIAIPSASNDQMRRIITLCRTTQVGDSAAGHAGMRSGIRFRTIPAMADLIAGRAMANQIREVSVTDVLGRDAVDMDMNAVGAMLHQQVVLVSGAGGSIGSEMCRTIARFAPECLILLDKAENSVFEIERELRRTFPALRLIPTIGDISDAVRVEQIFNQFTPHIVFHAAAHKHVPLAESNPGEAIRNNVFGTKTLADAAASFNVKNFVMISTDKAVNPTSIMGASKRCAEIYIQSLARRSRTNFITVRFGNVLGSNGSVVPIFKQQIAAGGPVTVTHPEMRRYFMTIPEAANLVLQAGALGQRGEIFVLDMGQPVRILDLARDLITLSGYRPEIDIPIAFTGLRPGEKLYEELSIRGENMVPTRHPKIGIWRSEIATAQRVHQMIDDLEPLQHCTERHPILATLTTYIPEMKPWKPEPEMPPRLSDNLDATTITPKV
jgi:FlaA1/EpsC-like NDP-sugar epimerase